MLNKLANMVFTTEQNIKINAEYFIKTVFEGITGMDLTKLNEMQKTIKRIEELDQVIDKMNLPARTL